MKLRGFLILMLLVFSTGSVFIQIKQVKATSVKILSFSDDFESGSINAITWPSTNLADVQNGVVKNGSYALRVNDTTVVNGAAWSRSNLNLTHSIISMWWRTNESLTDPIMDNRILSLTHTGNGGVWSIVANSTTGSIYDNVGPHDFPLTLVADTWYNITVSFDKNVITGSTNSTLWVDGVVKSNLTGLDTFAETFDTISLANGNGANPRMCFFDDVKIYTYITPAMPGTAVPLFEDDFEDDLAQWVETNYTVGSYATLSAAQVHGGSSSVLLYAEGDGVNIGSIDLENSTVWGVPSQNLWMQVWVYVERNDEIMAGAHVNEGSTWINGNDDNGDAASEWWLVDSSSSVNIVLGSWHLLELHTYIDPIVGYVEFYYDGVLIYTLAGVDTSSEATINYLALTLTANDVNGIIQKFYFDDFGVYYIPGDIAPPTYSLIMTNSTTAGSLGGFEITCTDDVALSHWIFSTNNTGTWQNDTAVAFTSTPETIIVVKTLNSTVGQGVGFRWYMNDTSGNWNTTGIIGPIILTAPPAGTHTITIGTPDGAGTLNIITGTYPDGPIYILASPSTNYVFTSYVINGTYYTTNPIVVNLVGDTTISAQFTYHQSEGGGGAPSGGDGGGGGGGSGSGGGGGGGAVPTPIPPGLSLNNLWQYGIWFFIALVALVILVGESRSSGKKNRDRWGSSTDSVKWGKGGGYE